MLSSGNCALNILIASDVVKTIYSLINKGVYGRRYPIIGENISYQNYIHKINNILGCDLIPYIIDIETVKKITTGKVFDEYFASLISQKFFIDNEIIHLKSK